MKNLSLFVTVTVVTLLALSPAVARADDEMEDLEVTMEVIDDVSQLDATIAEMEGPDDSDVDAEDWGDEERAAGSDDEESESPEANDDAEDEFDEELDNEREDEFEYDEDHAEDEMEDEGDFEDGEDVDEDEYDDDEEPL